MKVFRLFLLLIFISVSSALAANNLPLIFKKDSGRVIGRNFDKRVLKAYSLEKDFNYGEGNIDVSLTLWERFWAWFWREVGNAVFGGDSGFLSRYIFIALGCAVIIYALIKLAGMDARMIFTGKSIAVQVPYTESLENIHQISFDEEIEKAIQNQDHRLAVRLLYLRCLKKLSDMGRIAWEPDKTNAAYINELKNVNQKEQFKLLTRQFEYVWYGSFPLDKQGFNIINNSFMQFNREI